MGPYGFVFFCNVQGPKTTTCGAKNKPGSGNSKLTVPSIQIRPPLLFNFCLTTSSDIMSLPH